MTATVRKALNFKYMHFLLTPTLLGAMLTFLMILTLVASVWYVGGCDEPSAPAVLHQKWWSWLLPPLGIISVCLPTCIYTSLFLHWPVNSGHIKNVMCILHNLDVISVNPKANSAHFIIGISSGTGELFIAMVSPVPAHASPLIVPYLKPRPMFQLFKVSSDVSGMSFSTFLL